ncbi:hypothetical protein QUB68_07455, partial [Microcoleus sp. A006_D1]|uniref:hypothetical protein n=1 Tax=Microcoleus sp. A006_D1 TaxID=3055267 RepID=UPI002FD48278
IEIGLAVEIILTVSAVSRFIKYLCSSIANGWPQKVYHLISSRVAHVYRNRFGCGNYLNSICG